MTLSIGVAYHQDQWQTAFIENGQLLELCSFAQDEATWAYIERLCGLYPEPSIVLSLPSNTPFIPLTSSEILQRPDALARFQLTTRTFNLTSYVLPAIRFLPSVPPYRQLYRGNMGTPDTLSAVATLLYRLRVQEATWTEMHFLYLELAGPTTTIVVVEHGHVVDGVIIPPPPMQAEAPEELLELAFWENLSQQLAGLIAIHHVEDVVIMDLAMQGPTSRLEQVIERLDTLYQFYHYPPSFEDQQGFESAIGAALIAEGLYRPGLASEVVTQLQLHRS